MIESELKYKHSDSRDLAFIHYPKALPEAQFQLRMLQTLFKGAVVLKKKREVHIGPGPHPSIAWQCSKLAQKFGSEMPLTLGRIMGLSLNGFELSYFAVFH